MLFANPRRQVFSRRGPIIYIEADPRNTTQSQLKHNTTCSYKMDIFVALVFIFVFLCSLLVLKRPKGIPPGPLSLPILGSYFFMSKLRKDRPHRVFLQASERYGKIFSFHLGSQLVVVLIGYEAIHQALVKQAHVFSDRPNFLPAFRRVFKNGPEGILFQGYNHTWKTLRRFTLQTLRDFGVGKSSLEEKIMAEIDAVSDVLETMKGAPIEIASVLRKAIGNVIYGIVFGKRFDFNDPELDIIQRMSNVAVGGIGIGNVTNVFPLWLCAIFAPKASKEAAFRRQNLENIKKFISDEIKEHEKTYDENNIRDFVDLYIQASHDSKEETASVLTEGNMFRVIQELFIAGAETTYNTLDWAFLFMSEYPDIQAKCQEEIENTVGDRAIKYSDRTNLKYIEATITEIQRHANVASMALQHCASQDTTLMGYHIPKKTVILTNLYSSNMDPDHWEDPKKFNPNRFLDERGNLIKHDALMPFSVGPRACLGEPLARLELFLVFANLLQKFRFERENSNVGHSMELKPNQLTSAPYPYKIRALRRYNMEETI